MVQHPLHVCFVGHEPRQISWGPPTALPLFWALVEQDFTFLWIPGPISINKIVFNSISTGTQKRAEERGLMLTLDCQAVLRGYCACAHKLITEVRSRRSIVTTICRPQLFDWPTSTFMSTQSLPCSCFS